MRFWCWALLLVWLTWPGFAEGIIVLLNGTGSAGKSSIGRELDRTLENAVFLSEELLVLNAYVHLLQEHHLQPPKPLRDIGELMDYRHTLPSEQEAALKADFRRSGDDFIKQDMRGLIGLNLSQGKDVVIDNSMWTREQIEEWEETTRGFPTLHVVVYCSLKVLLEHIQARNLWPLTYEHRDIALPLEMYFSLYQPVEEGEVDHVDRTTVERDLVKALAYKRRKDPDWEQDDASLIQEYLARFGLDEHETVKIAPFFAYDLCVNTGTQTTPQCAAEIKQLLRVRHARAAGAARGGGSCCGNPAVLPAGCWSR